MKFTRKRTRAREISIQALYQYDAQLKTMLDGHPLEGTENDPDEPDEIERFIAKEADDPEVRDFARDLVRGTCEALEEIDNLLARVVEHWKLERVAAMDRAILRLAAFELSTREDIPPKVAINEAINLAKKYSTSRSGAFVNGILDRLLQLREKGGEADNS